MIIVLTIFVTWHCIDISKRWNNESENNKKRVNAYNI